MRAWQWDIFGRKGETRKEKREDKNSKIGERPAEQSGGK